MFFEDFTKTGCVYHIAAINDLKKIMSQGIKYNDKASYKEKYCGFHQLFDDQKPAYIPKWVERKKAIFATMNYRKKPGFHSHTVVMALKIDIKRCWIANENKANQLYEPFILKNILEYNSAENYLQTKGKEIIKNYWSTSLSFENNLLERADQKENYDAEVLIFHEIPPENIRPLFIVSDHRVQTINQWKKIFS
ncbi:hypothetical protein RH915_03880 [Serpentinicella sp. ANB-PHB4]|uniref:hypothetical protein n=1 Tax=Serpentinicella sp. ANB-PHB4 TaxID=3074076 RepID=UPI00285F9BF3|nr:hypothetical protein [Serpentinicella sp. ANB-PHB4]MDR5658624.1 hypothetical protein [Serpentinicella sp. ANB-PHB4]